MDGKRITVRLRCNTQPFARHVRMMLLRGWKAQLGWRRFFIGDWWRMFFGRPMKQIAGKWSAAREMIMHYRGHNVAVSGRAGRMTDG